jgi:hypothetical protein
MYLQGYSTMAMRLAENKGRYGGSSGHKKLLWMVVQLRLLCSYHPGSEVCCCGASAAWELIL